MAKPVVDGIEKELRGQDVAVVRLSVNEADARDLAVQYGVIGVPTLFVLDQQGESVLTQVGRVHKDVVLQAVAEIQ